MDFELIATKAHPLGGFFLARLPDGQLLAGRDQATARTFPDAQAVIDHYRPAADAGSHSAWNLCYAAEDVCGPAVT